MLFVGRDDIPPTQGNAGCHPAPRHLVVYHYRILYVTVALLPALHSPALMACAKSGRKPVCTRIARIQRNLLTHLTQQYS
jgi:hypothetical protein